MDLNDLFYRQQVARFQSSTAQSESARRAHGALARCLEKAISRETEGRIVFPA